MRARRLISRPGARAASRAGERRALDWTVLLVVAAAGLTAIWSGVLIWAVVAAVRWLLG